MTSKFNWDSYKTVDSSENGFDWGKYESEPSEKPKMRMGEKQGRIAGQLGMSAIDRAALPYTMAAQMQGSETFQKAEYRQGLLDELERLADLKRMGLWDEQDEQNLQSIQAQLTDPSVFEEKTQHIKSHDITPSGLIKKGIRETTGYDL